MGSLNFYHTHFRNVVKADLYAVGAKAAVNDHGGIFFGKSAGAFLHEKLVLRRHDTAQSRNTDRAAVEMSGKHQVRALPYGFLPVHGRMKKQDPVKSGIGFPIKIRDHSFRKGQFFSEFFVIFFFQVSYCICNVLFFLNFSKNKKCKNCYKINIKTNGKPLISTNVGPITTIPIINPLEYELIIAVY